MLSTVAVANYRSISNLVAPLGQLNLITGANGSGKSNLYRTLRLLAETAQGGVIGALAREGGLGSTLWAGPKTISRAVKSGDVNLRGVPRADRLRLGFATDEYNYAISLAMAGPSASPFGLDPEIKKEVISAGPFYTPARMLVSREGPLIRVRDGKQWQIVATEHPPYNSLFDSVGNLRACPEVLMLREYMRRWRFYDHFRCDGEAPARQPQLGTRTVALHHDGRDLAAALATINDIGDPEALRLAVSDAFPGAELAINESDGRFSIAFHQQGLMRPLSGAELSDGTLRYLLLCAALLTPRPPTLMVLNEPETSLHPDLLPALARQIIAASAHCQVWVVSHSMRLIAALEQAPQCAVIALEKDGGETRVSGQGMLDQPAWHWAD